jgi:hypothetical protein
LKTDIEKLRQKIIEIKEKDFSITDEKLNQYQRRKRGNDKTIKIN